MPNFDGDKDFLGKGAVDPTIENKKAVQMAVPAFVYIEDALFYASRTHVVRTDSPTLKRALTLHRSRARLRLSYTITYLVLETSKFQGGLRSHAG